MRAVNHPIRKTLGRPSAGRFVVTAGGVDHPLGAACEPPTTHVEKFRPNRERMLVGHVEAGPRRKRKGWQGCERSVTGNMVGVPGRSFTWARLRP